MDLVVKEPVIIAGAGPVGCVVALYLAQRGVPVTVLEGEPQLPLDLRASTFHPPTLDMLDTLGLTSRLIDQGLIAPTYQYRDRRTGEAAIFDLKMIADQTRYPFRLQCEQFRLTQIAVEMLALYPHAKVVFNCRVEQVDQDSRGVTVHAESPTDGFCTFNGSHLIGADGANSRVRKSLAVNFEGFTYPERFLVISTPLDIGTIIPGLSFVNYVSDPEEWCVLLRTRSLWRILVPTEQSASDAELLHDDFVQARLNHLTDLPGPFEVSHRTLYRVHQRVAAQWRVGRVLLAGDACHVNNPLGGMGMNGGIHDAFSVAEKLHAVIVRRTDDEVLSLYERQRRGICIRFVQEHTIRNKKLLEEKDPGAQAARQAEFMQTAADPVKARAFLLRATMIQSLRDAASIP